MHEHDWQPIPLEAVRYQCTCGATGYRKRGAIVEHKVRPELRRTWTASSTTKWADGRAGYRPSEDWESWSKDD